MRQALRALEDGSYVSRAAAPAPGTVIQVQYAGPVDDDASHRQTRECLRSMVSALVTFLDQIIGADRLVKGGLKVPPGGLKGPKEAIDFVQKALDQQIA